MLSSDSDKPPYQAPLKQAWRDGAVVEGRLFPPKNMLIKMMLWWEAALADAVAAGDGTVHAIFPLKWKLPPCLELQESCLHLLHAAPELQSGGQHSWAMGYAGW